MFWIDRMNAKHVMTAMYGPHLTLILSILKILLSCPLRASTKTVR